MINDIGRALQHWQLEPTVSIERATSGVMNETYLITTDRRRVVFRRHRRPRRDQVEFEHAVIAHARANRIPAPAAIPTPEGEVIVEQDGVFHSLFDFARGHQLPRAQLTVRHARSMGTMLATLDLALADFAVPVRPPSDRSPDLAPVASTVTTLLDRIDRRTGRSEQDQWAAEHLRSKAAWLRTATPPQWQQPPADALQLIHGDYQESNLFFDEDGTVVDVIDWDKAESGWPVAEVVRTLDLALQLQPELSAALLSGYRSLRPITTAELDLAAGNWHFSQVHDHWLFEGIYIRGDDRLRIFLRPGPFVPFAERWRRLRATVS
ncbi:phosphotransferase [Microlunatus soli]|uniref:Phosphotransferase enzyme family protein n=1 Tax=Microlunatus soli TaxID=630515 RepID=A0A1H1YT31_9ACTN|nr:phosphotransferase [Microlunatus soli]SDT24553.1 Phosphotransferase enzyme family protein [Microlunatus soli]